MCHLVSVLTERNSAQSSSASPSQMLLSASFPTHPPHTIQPGLNNEQPLPVPGSYRVRVFLSLVADEIKIIILLVVQDFFLVLSLVV